MAVAADSERIKKINEHLTCQICLEVYKQPKTLPCQHTFCCDCLSDYVRKQLNKTVFPCPLCRQNTTVPAGGVSSFPTNFLIRNIAEEVDAGQAEDTESAPAACESCEANDSPGVQAVAFCEECMEYLCHECVEAHSRLKLTRDHKVKHLPKETLASKKSPKKRPRKKPQKKSPDVSGSGDSPPKAGPGQPWLCKSHSEQDIQYFCLTCSTPMCGACLAELIGKSKHKHTNHKIESLDNAQASVQGDLDGQLSEVQEMCAEATQGVAYVAELEKALQNSHSNIVVDINDAADHFKTIVDRWVENMTKKAENLRHEKQEELVSEMRTIQASANKIRAGEQSVRDKIKHGGMQVLMKKGELMTQLSELRKSYSAAALPQPIKFALTEMPDDTTSVRLHSMLGDVRIEGPSVGKAESMTSLVSDMSLETETAKHAVSAKVVCSYRPVRGKLTGICITRSGQFLAVDMEAKVVLHYNLNEKYRFSLVAKYGEKALSEPLDIDQLPDGRVVVSDGKAGHSVKLFQPVKGTPNWQMCGNIAHSLLQKATGIATTPDNQIIVTDVDKQVVYRLELQGGDRFKVNMEIRKFNGKLQFESPQFVACSQTGDFVVSDRTQSCVKVYGPNGKFKSKYGHFGFKGRQMRKPGGVCFDAQGRMYIADVLNQRIHILGRDGKFLSYIPLKKVCGRFLPTPDMVAITAQGDLLLANEEGYVKILKLDFN